MGGLRRRGWQQRGEIAAVMAQRHQNRVIAISLASAALPRANYR